MPFTLTLDTSVLSQILKKIAVTLPAEYDARISGALVIGGESLQVVSSEGAMLAVIKRNIVSPEGQTILSTGTLNLLRSLIRNNPAKQTSITAGADVTATCGQRTLKAPPAGTSFPSIWKDFLFTDPTMRADFPGPAALAALDRVVGDAVHVTLAIERGALKFLSDNGSDEIGVDYDGEPEKFMYKAEFLTGILRAIDAPRIEWLGKGPGHHCIFRPLDDAHLDQYVLAPMKANAS